MTRLTVFLGVLSFLLSGNRLGAQIAEKADSTENIILLKEQSGGIVLHSQGLGLKYTRGKNIDAFKKKIFEVEMVEMKSPRQVRQINPYSPNSKSFVFGKLNAVFMLRGALGRHHLLNRKPYWGGVELRYFYHYGLSIGLAKPIYLYSYDQSNPNKPPVAEKYDPEVHFAEYILGRAPFTKGIDETKIYPGIHLKGGFSFDYSIYNNKIKSLEVGAALDGFIDPIPVMAFNDPEYFFITFFINFNLGKRYN